MKNILYSIMLLTLFASCKNKSIITTQQGTGELPTDFVDFYEKFHRDSVFQIEHCLFPMEGLPDQADSTLNPADFRWTAENWRMHKPVDEKESGMVRTFSIISNGMINERMLNEKQGIGMERRFAKMGDEWNLIYYVGVNQYRKN